ncbi:MAG: type I asparaginase [Bacteroidales bacterium]|nr:type I asparaginase [Bacteroidales bacterium]
MKNILVIYTGGTIGMVKDEKTGALRCFDMKKIYEILPVLKELNCNIETYQFNPIIDSSDMNAKVWLKLSQYIKAVYDLYDGFVILHGTDTMSYTASALSFLLENLAKPVIITGSQLPLGMIRNDGRDNIISSIELAANTDVLIPEVCIFFDDKLYRGNRTTKINAEYFEAFYSGNMPSLAKVGINISYKEHLILPKPEKELKVYENLCEDVAILKIHPSIQISHIDCVANIPNLKGLILETYGSGNAPTNPEFLSAIKRTIEKGITVYNVTQCKAGKVQMGHYAASYALREMGVLSGKDITTEAALAKMMFVLGNFSDKTEIRNLLENNLRGEITL